jgi:hypothetical protein
MQAKIKRGNMVSEKTLARMSDESRFPTDEVAALVYKMLLQHCVEMDFLDELMKRHEDGQDLSYDAEVAKVAEGQRQVHLEFRKKFPEFKYANELSYAYNMEEGQPQILSVDEEGNSIPFKNPHDFNRDAIINDTMEKIFKYHTQVFEDGTYEFCWGFTGREHDVTYKHLPGVGQSLH